MSLSPDSAVYLSSAAHLLQGSGLKTYSGHTLVLFPPGFPALVSAIGWLLGVDVATAARILNVVSLAVAVAAACVLLRRHVESRPLQFAGAVGVAGAAPLVDVASHAWSEPTFIAFMLLAVLAIEDLLERPTRSAFLAAGTLVSAAFLIRYSGLALLLTGVGSMLIYGCGASWKARLVRGAVTGAVMVSVPAAWLGRNLAVAGTAFGGRETPNVAMSVQLRRAGGEIASWLVPRYLPAGLRLAGIGVIAAAALAVAARLLSSSVRARRRSLIPLVLFSGSYLLLLAVSAAVTQIDPLGARLLSPLFVPAVVIGLALLDRVRDAGLQSARTALTLGVVCWAALAIVAGARRAHELAPGEGYSSAIWRSSALALRLRQSQSGNMLLFSNRPDAVWATTRHDARCLPPQVAEPCVGSSGDSGDLRLLESGRARAEFAWFAAAPGSPPPRRRGRILFDLKISAADGALYTLGFLRRPSSGRG
ncbi:MAG: hypothetical protein ACXW0R_04200 [Gaiellaceae bacterium]